MTHTITEERDLPPILREALHDGRFTFAEWIAFARCLDLEPTGRWVGNMPEMRRIIRKQGDDTMKSTGIFRRIHLMFEYWLNSPTLTLMQAWRKAGRTI